jgi:hypothetical protein
LWPLFGVKANFKFFTRHGPKSGTHVFTYAAGQNRTGDSLRFTYDAVFQLVPNL